MSKGFIAYFYFSRGNESFNLELAHGDYTFVWFARIYDGKGGSTSREAHGRWTQTGDDITFVVEHVEPGCPVPTRATDKPCSVEVEGFGEFQLDR